LENQLRRDMRVAFGINNRKSVRQLLPDAKF
jgi:hypothetical protein